MSSPTNILQSTVYYDFHIDYIERIEKQPKKYIRIAQIVKDFVRDVNRTNRYFCTCMDDDYIELWSLRRVEEIAQNSRR